MTLPVTESDDCRSERRSLGTIGRYRVVRVLRSGASHKARVVKAVRDDGVRCVIKELSLMTPWYRVVFGRRMLGREVRAMEGLADTGLAPAVLERISRDAVAIEFVEGSQRRKGYLRKNLSADRMPAVLASLERAVQGLHKVGVVHFDLRQRKNILVRADNEVMLIDFESSWRFGGMTRFLLPLVAWVDRGAVVKWKNRFAPDLMTDQDRRQLRIQKVVKFAWPIKGIVRLARRTLLGSSPKGRGPANQG